MPVGGGAGPSRPAVAAVAGALLTLFLLGCPTEPSSRRTPTGTDTGAGATGGSGSSGGTSGGGTSGGAAGDYSLTVDPASVAVPTGGSKVITVTAHRTGGFTGEIDLSIGGLPSRMSATTAVISPLGATAAMVLSAQITSDFTPGQCVVTGHASGMPARTALFSCGFTTGAPVQGFTMSVSPATLTMSRNTTSALTVTVSRRNSYTGTAFFTVEGLPSGGSYYTPGIPYNANTGTIQIATKTTTPTGTYRLTIKGTTGTSQYLVEEQTVQLVVR